MRANHLALGVQYVIFDAKIWNVLRDDEGWRPYGSVTGSINDSSMHYNHVHVTVFGTKGTGPVDSVGVDPGRWTMPLPAGTYTVGCSMTCYPGHTGQDFRAPVGTEVRSSNAGIVVRSEALKDRDGHYVSYGNLIVDPGRRQADHDRLVRPPVRPARRGRRPRRRRPSHRSHRQHRQLPRPPPALRDPRQRQGGRTDGHPSEERSHALSTFQRPLVTMTAVAAVLLAAFGGLLTGRQWATSGNPSPVTTRVVESSSTAPDSPTRAPVGGNRSSVRTFDTSEGGPSDDSPASDSDRHWEPVIEGFAEAFTTTNRGRKAWLDQMQPYVTDAVLDSLETVDPSDVPDGSYIEFELVQDDGTQITARILYDEGWSMVLYLIADGASWSVYRYDRFEE